MNQCPWIPEHIYRFGDMHLLFDDALAGDGKLSQNGTGENIDDVIEAFKYTFSKPGIKFTINIVVHRDLQILMVNAYKNLTIFI